jgi:tight adherence protein B
VRWLGLAAVAALAVYLLWVGRSARSAADARGNITRHLVSDDVAADRKPRSRLLGWLEGRRASSALRDLHSSSGIPVSWHALLGCWLAALILLPVAAFLLTSSLFALPAGLAVALALPGLAMKLLAMSRQRRAREECDRLAADLALFLRSGIPVAEALGLSARGLWSPTLVEAIERFQSDVALGSDVGASLVELVGELGNRDLELIAQAMVTSRETGSEISGIMDTIGEAVRERSSIRRELSTQTVQGRMSGRVVAALPLIFLTLSILVSRNTLRVLVGTVPGLVILVVGVSMNVAGFLWIRKILDIKE